MKKKKNQITYTDLIKQFKNIDNIDNIDLNAESKEKLNSFRHNLSQIPFRSAMDIIYGSRWDGKRPKILSHIAKLRRSTVLEWLYGKSPLVNYSSYIRLPSSEKVEFVKDMLKGIKKRCPWISSKVIHAWAFRQKYFDDPVKKKITPLYLKREIPKTKNSFRTLYVPIWPLALVQKSILNNHLNPILEKLPVYVHGFRPNSDHTIFQHVSAHLNSRFIATFDIKDFFPSVKLRHIIKELQKVGFHQEVAVLIAKLCTYKGQLPQGAPTSPALAQIVFAPIDRHISKSLPKGIKYTRYADDIAVSTNSKTLNKLNIKTPQEFQKKIKEELEKCLSKTDFKLHPKKGKASDLTESGFNMVGLKIEKKKVSLSREKRRTLRALCHNLKTQGLTVQDKIDKVQSQEENKSKGLKAKGKINLVYSFVHLLLLRYPEIDVKIHENSSSIISMEKTITKKLLWIIILLWADFLKKSENSTMSHIKLIDDTNNQPVCDIYLPTLKSIELLNIDTLTQKRLAKIYDHINGYMAFLNSAPKDKSFDRFREYADQIKKLLQEADIKSSSLVLPSESLEFERDNTLFSNLTYEIYSELGRLQKNMNIPPTIWGQHSAVFTRQPDNRKKLIEWLRSTISLLKPMIMLNTSNSWDLNELLSIMAIIQLYVDVINGQRNNDYRELNVFYKTTVIIKGPQDKNECLVTVDEFAKHLWKCIKEINRKQTSSIENTDKTPMDMEIIDEKKLVFDSDQQSLINSLFKEFEKLVSDEKYSKIFRRYDKENRKELFKVFEKPEDNKQPAADEDEYIPPGKGWRTLFEFGFLMHKLIDDRIEEHISDLLIDLSKSEVCEINRFNKMDRNKKKRRLINFILDNSDYIDVLNTIRLLRNFHAHNIKDDNETKKQWTTIQSYISKIMHREWKAPQNDDDSKKENNHSVFFSENDLPLTHYEAIHASKILIHKVIIILKAIKAQEGIKWEPKPKTK